MNAFSTFAALWSNRKPRVGIKPNPPALKLKARSLKLSAFAVLITLSAGSLALALVLAGWKIGPFWVTGILAAVSALGDWQIVRINRDTEVSISFLLIIFAVIVLGPIPAIVISVASILPHIWRPPWEKDCIWLSVAVLKAGLSALICFSFAPQDKNFQDSLWRVGVALAAYLILDLIFSIIIDCSHHGRHGVVQRVRVYYSSQTTQITSSVVLRFITLSIFIYLPIIIGLVYSYNHISAWALLFFIGPAIAAQNFSAIAREQAETSSALRLAVNRHLERIEKINALQKEIGAVNIERGQMLALVCRQAQALSGGEGAAIILRKDINENFSFISTSGCAAERQGRFIEKQSLAGSFSAGPNIIEYTTPTTHLELPGLSSLISVPFYGGEQGEGLLQVYTTDILKHFAEEDIQGVSVCAVILSAELTRSAELKARRTEVEALAHFQTLFSSAPIAIVKGDVEGNITEANPAAERLLGYSVEELKSLRFQQLLIDPAVVARDRDLYLELLDGKSEVYRLAGQFRRKDGNLFWGQVTTALERSSVGEPLNPIAMIEDVSEQKAASERREQKQKTEAVGQLTAGIAHEFNNLLMGILGYTELGRAEAQGGNDPTPFLDEALGAGHKAAKLVKQMLSFGRRANLQPKEINLNLFVKETTQVIARMIGEDVEVKMSLSPELPSIDADPDQIKQVLLNLALNARDAMPLGGNLQITTDCISVNASPRFHALELTPGEYIRLTISDSGSGMSEEIQTKIFEPFFTTKEVGEGSGLGLSSVYGIVKQSLGAIEVESAEGKGSTFRIYLPAKVQTKVVALSA